MVIKGKSQMLGLLKCFSSIGAIIMLVVGLLFTGITVYAFLNQDVFITDENIKHTVLNSLIIVSTVVVAVAIDGIIGVVRKKCCMILIYQLFVLIFFAVFLSIGIGSKVLPDKVFEGNCTESANSLIKDANYLYTTSDELFCHAACPCSLSSTSLGKYTEDEQKILKANYTFSDSGVASTQNCNDFKNKTNQTTVTVADTMREIENIFECSDWCESTNDNLFYRYSDVNKGKPKHFCYTILKDSFYSYSNVVGLTSFIIAGVFLLVCVCNLCLCCHPDQKELKFRDRFILVAERPSNDRGYYNLQNERQNRRY